MGTVVVDVMPKSESPDPSGESIADALRGEGVDLFTSVRQGRRFVLTVPGAVTRQVLAAATAAAQKHMADPATEEVVSVRAAGDATDLDDDVNTDWDDMPEYWGGVDTAPSEAGQRAPRPPVRHHDIDASMLGQVESGSYYGRADDVR